MNITSQTVKDACAHIELFLGIIPYYGHRIHGIGARDEYLPPFTNRKPRLSVLRAVQ